MLPKAGTGLRPPQPTLSYRSLMKFVLLYTDSTCSAMAYCEATRQQFAGLFTKPALTDKVLQRPPFKFIHDIVAATAKNSEFAQGLFADELGDAANIKGSPERHSTSFVKTAPSQTKIKRSPI